MNLHKVFNCLFFLFGDLSQVVNDLQLLVYLVIVLTYSFSEFMITHFGKLNLIDDVYQLTAA
jgi:hypothetical protein